MKRHLVIGLMTGIVAAAIGAVLNLYGVHGVPGNIAVIFGYPAILFEETLSLRYSEPIFTCVNWLFYFLLIEGIVALRRKLSA